MKQVLLSGGLAIALFVALADYAAAQNVSMSGDYGSSWGSTSNFPINPPLVPCTNAQEARCHQSVSNQFGRPIVRPLAEPSSGIGVAGAGVVVMPGGLAVGDAFTIPPEVFQQKGVSNVTPIVNNAGLVQLNTTISAVMPAPARATNPPPNTRQFEAGAWSQPGNGMTGRIAANTTPISGATQLSDGVTVRYTAGPNAFGGTMANLMDLKGALYLSGAAVMSSSGETSTRPWIGSVPLGDGSTGQLQTSGGAGWGIVQTRMRSAGVIRSQAGIATACTQSMPPAPAGCGLVTKIEGETIGTIPSATSSQVIYAYTTGTVSVLVYRYVGQWPSVTTLTAMGYDTVSGTGTTAVRNIGLVAGGYTRRVTSPVSPASPRIVGLNMRFTPEPRSTAALFAGLLVLSAGFGRYRST